MVFIGDTASYLPVAPPSSPEDPVDWQHPIESWDREYRRFRFNTTRVQRELYYDLDNNTESVSGAKLWRFCVIRLRFRRESVRRLHPRPTYQ